MKSNGERWQGVNWIDDSHFELSGLRFLCTLGDYTKKTTEDEIVLLKNKGMVASYAALLDRYRPERVLEFGIFEGGSPILLTALGNLKKFVGIDIRKESKIVASLLDRHPVGKSISLYYETNQGDADAVRRIIRSEFGNDPIDLIIDDASHMYALTKTSLETSFGFLKPGGLYSIEDWGWAHWPGVWQTEHNHFHGKPALSNLIFELVIGVAAAPRVIAGVDIRSGWQAVVTRGHALEHAAEMSLDAICLNRGRPLPAA